METSFTPIAWDAPRALPLVDAYEENAVLAAADLWATGAEGPEDVIINTDGSVIVGTADGMLLRVDGSNASARQRWRAAARIGVVRRRHPRLQPTLDYNLSAKPAR